MDEKEFFVRYASLVHKVCAPEQLKQETWEEESPYQFSASIFLRSMVPQWRSFLR